MEYIVTDSASAVKAEPWLICFAPEKENCHYILNDFWKDLPAESYLYSSAFSGDYQSETTIKVTASADGSITFGPYALVCIISVKCWLSAEIARFRQLGYSKDGPDGRNTTERVDHHTECFYFGVSAKL